MKETFAPGIFISACPSSIQALYLIQPLFGILTIFAMIKKKYI